MRNNVLSLRPLIASAGLALAALAAPSKLPTTRPAGPS